MLSFLKKVFVYIKIYPDEMEVFRSDTRTSLKRRSKHKFSTERLVVADFHNAEAHLTGLIKELFAEKSIATSRLVMMIQQMVNFPDGLTEVEKRTLRDLAEYTGAVEVHIIEHSQELDSDALNNEIDFIRANK